MRLVNLVIVASAVFFAAGAACTFIGVDCTDCEATATVEAPCFVVQLGDASLQACPPAVDSGKVDGGR